MEKIGAYAVECPACQVPAGEKCTTPTDHSRRPVGWVHFAREALALEQQEEAHRLDAPAVPAHTLPGAHVRWIAPRGGGYRPGGDFPRDIPVKPFQGNVTPPPGGGGVGR